MTPKLQLRDYQVAGITDLISRWDAGGTRVPMVLATGLGKTIMFSDLAEKWIEELHKQYGLGKRVLGIAHTDELISQMAKSMRRANPGKRVGIVKGPEHNDVSADIIVSSRQTLLHKKRREQIRNVGLIIVDECHHALRNNTYGKILEHFGAFPADCPDCYEGQPMVDTMACPNGPTLPPRVKVAGFTATLARGDKEKLSTVWEDVSYRKDILFGIRHGYLLDVRGERITVPDFDMSNVGKTGGDYDTCDIADELERTFAPEIIARDYKRLAGGRKGIVFWPLVETAEHGADAFNAEGITSEVIHGKLGKTERRAMLQRLHTGETQVIHGVAVLTEGFDEPTVDVVVIARPTRSAPLYQQMVGRVLRPNLLIPASDREKALILDVVGAGTRHDLRSLIDLAPERPLNDGDGELSLLEAANEYEEFFEEAARGQHTFEFEGAESYTGETTTVAFDPLGREKLWAQTPAGTWFMSAGGDAYVFLVDSLAGDPGTFDVVVCGETWARGTDHKELPMDMALAWGEEEAIEIGGYGTKTLTARKSKWRLGEATQAQKTHARKLGINPDGMTKGEVSEAIDAVYAARRIDPLVRTVTGA